MTTSTTTITMLRMKRISTSPSKQGERPTGQIECDHRAFAQARNDFAAVLTLQAKLNLDFFLCSIFSLYVDEGLIVAPVQPDKLIWNNQHILLLLNNNCCLCCH